MPAMGQEVLSLLVLPILSSSALTSLSMHLSLLRDVLIDFFWMCHCLQTDNGARFDFIFSSIAFYASLDLIFVEVPLGSCDIPRVSLKSYRVG